MDFFELTRTETAGFPFIHEAAALHDANASAELAGAKQIMSRHQHGDA